MSWSWLRPVALVACLIQGAYAEDAKCSSGDFAWANNNEGKDPCQLANALLTKCNTPPFAMLPPGTAMYGGPGENNDCLCNFVEYNLLRVCAKCQNAIDAWVEDFPDWSKNCARHDVNTFSPGPPDGVSIPGWASAGNIAGPWTLEALKPSTPPDAGAKTSAAPVETTKAFKKLEPTTSQTTDNPEQKQAEAPPPPSTSSTEPETAVTGDPEPKTTEEEQKEKASDRTSPASVVKEEAQVQPPPTSQITATEQEESGPATSDRKSTYSGGYRAARPSQGRYDRPSTEVTGESDDDSDHEVPSSRWLPSSTEVEDAGPTSVRSDQGFGVKHAPGTETSTTAPPASNEPTQTSEEYSIQSELDTDHASSVAQSSSLVPQLPGPTGLGLSPVSSTSSMATELLVAQETSASNDGSPSETSDNDDADGDQNPRTDSVRGSLAHSADKGKAQEDTETGTGRYQYNGDPGAITTEDSGKDQKTKIAAICITVLALLVLAVVGFKVFMCLRKRSEGDSDRESWMEAESVISEKYEIPTHKGILGRQSVWDRIQKSLMPKPAAQVAPVPPLTYFPDESGLPSEDAGNVHLGNSQTERDPRSQHPPNQERQSFWSKCRKSFGPFSRPSFIPPTPTPNLAALRGITVPKAFRPGILKRQVPGRTGNSDANEQEVLEDEEAIGPRHIPRQVDAGHTIADIPYVPRAQEQRRWI